MYIRLPLSVCSRISARLPLDGFPLHFILGPLRKSTEKFQNNRTTVSGNLYGDPSTFIQCVPLATEPGISLIILPVMRILQRNLKRTTDTFLFISHTTNVLLFKFRCNIFIGVRIIKEMTGSVASGTPCINEVLFYYPINSAVLILLMWFLFDTVACFGCPYQPSSGRHRFKKRVQKGESSLLQTVGVKLL